MGGDDPAESPVTGHLRHEPERGTPQQHRVAPVIVAVGRHRDRLLPRRVDGEQSPDGLDRDVGLVAEHDQGCIDLLAQRLDPNTQ
jgi:hypothetical protein